MSKQRANYPIDPACPTQHVLSIGEVLGLLLYPEHFRLRIRSTYRSIAFLNFVLDRANELFNGEVSENASNMRIWQSIRLFVVLVELDEYEWIVAGS